MFKIIITRLKELQGENSVSSFARFLEMPQKTVDTYINGQRKPSVEFIMRVCSKCHVSADWLLGLSEARDGQNDVGQTTPVTKKRQIQFEPRIDVLTEIAAMKRRMQQLEAAAIKQLQPSAACCG